MLYNYIYIYCVLVVKEIDIETSVDLQYLYFMINDEPNHQNLDVFLCFPHSFPYIFPWFPHGSLHGSPHGFPTQVATFMAVGWALEVQPLGDGRLAEWPMMAYGDVGHTLC